MKRFPAFEFPEYIDWQPDSEIQTQFHQKAISFLEQQPVSNDFLLRLYEQLLLSRLHDIQLKRWVKQGVISKAWLGAGEEAVTIGMCAALEQGDVVGPMIRNAGALISRGMPMQVCLEAYLGTTNTIAQGRDLHIGDPTLGIIPPISHVGDILPVMAGFALSFKLRKQAQVAITWTGDGSTATGIFHEGMRVASSLGVPLISVIQDNQVALGTLCKVHNQGAFKAFAEVYGIPCFEVDGNHVLDCYFTTLKARQFAIAHQKPVLIVAKTFRMGGHATHDEKEARRLFSDDVYAYWGKKDPIGCYETWLQTHRKIELSTLQQIENQCLALVDQSAAQAQASKFTHAPKPDQLTVGVYA